MPPKTLGAVQQRFGQADPAYDELWEAVRRAPQFAALFGASFDAMSPMERKLVAVRALVPLERARLGRTDLSARRAASRAAIRDLAESKGIPWRRDEAALRARGEAAWERERRAIERDAVVTPDYYVYGGVGPLHSYDAGNCNWDAAFGVASGAYELVHAHHFPDVPPSQCFFALHRALDEEALRALPPGLRVRRAVDVGCGAGTSTFSLLRTLREAGHGGAALTGVDLSTHYLAIARYRQREGDMQKQGLTGIDFTHADGCNLQSAGFAAASCELAMLSAVTHEMPAHVSALAVREAARVLRPGGVFAYFDLNPAQLLRDNAVSNLVTRTAVANEPFFPEFLGFDLLAAVRGAGLEVVKVRPTNETIWPNVADCSCWIVIARKPATGVARM